MPSERIQRRIDQYLDEAEAASDAGDWDTMLARAEAVLEADSANQDAATLAAMARRNLGNSPAGTSSAPASPAVDVTPPLPTAFVSDRYQVQALLGEGTRKVVYRAHHRRLDRDVAFALIKTAGLDAAGCDRVGDARH